jgi:hypothetical protein
MDCFYFLLYVVIHDSPLFSLLFVNPLSHQFIILYDTTMEQDLEIMVFYISRMIFPITFSTFHLMYWTIYIYIAEDKLPDDIVYLLSTPSH